MANSTLVVSITGIAVSGVVGPMATAWAQRRAHRQQFERDLAAKRRDDLRDLVDEAANLLGAGATNLRVAREVAEAGGAEPADVREWASRVHLLYQRLLLRLPPEHEVARDYESVRAILEKVGEAPDAAIYAQALQAFETARSRFLENARQALTAPVAEESS